MYTACCFRPDIAHALKGTTRSSHRPGPKHWQALQHIVRYLDGTTDISLTLTAVKGPPVLHIFSDADDANNLDDRRSISSIY
jgi:hypothetical protein